ncbi:MAG TPA: class I SAM-dependent methyltransferase [Bdellovibrionota bacterium]|nr:class I SAM-dependent methyltransferase [Bdellovibrionota bacterium]
MDSIEIPSVALLEQHHLQVEEIRSICKALQIPLGWHYLLDLVWTHNKLQPKSGMVVLDAGAGYGPMQWWLAAKGVSVVSVDRSNRSVPPTRFRDWTILKGLREEDLTKASRWIDWKKSMWNLFGKAPCRRNDASDRGTVSFYHQDLTSLRDLPSNSFDAIVSISALEHNAPNLLREIVTELLRVLQPGQPLLATLHAAKERDWFHEPSKGWCYTEGSLRKLFRLEPGATSNYHEYDFLMQNLRDSAELRKNLDPVYFQSGRSGMPWGVWNPEYQPVGIMKIKAQANRT